MLHYSWFKYRSVQYRSPMLCTVCDLHPQSADTSVQLDSDWNYFQLNLLKYRYSKTFSLPVYSPSHLPETMNSCLGNFNAMVGNPRDSRCKGVMSLPSILDGWIKMTLIRLVCLRKVIQPHRSFSMGHFLGSSRHLAKQNWFREQTKEENKEDSWPTLNFSGEPELAGSVGFYLRDAS